MAEVWSWLGERLTMHPATADALETSTLTLTYARLVDRVESLAADLRGRLPDHAELVAIEGARSSIETVLAVLATWADRRIPILGDTESHVSQAVARLERRQSPGLDEASWDWRVAMAVSPVASPACTDPAYVIGTSGTTGPPAPVLVHASPLRDAMYSLADRYHLDEHSRMLQFASPSYDAWLADVIPPLLAGGCIVLSATDPWFRPGRMAVLFGRREITHVVLPPTFLRQMLAPVESATPGEPPFRALQVLISAGEALEPTLAERLRPLVPQLVNAYGPTEGTVCVTAGEPLTVGDACSAGEPLRNVNMRLLDERGLVIDDVGRVGQVVIGPPSAAHGYIGSAPDARHHRFQSVASGGGCDNQRFVTGDLAMWSGSDLVVVGRVDDEVKVVGQRIRLNDLENVIRSLPQVADCCVATIGGGLGCAWIPAWSTGGSVPEGLAELTAFERLPIRWRVVDGLPSGVSDKVDRLAVGLLFSTSQQAGVQNDADALSSIWLRHLPDADGTDEENFFAVGGDSLTAMELLDVVEEELGAFVDLGDFVGQPTLGYLRGLLKDTDS